jgi:nucleoside-diphosphate-sugar epimerase
MQTILGANSAVATELAKELKKHTENIRLVSRNPKKVNDTDQLMQADLSNARLLDEAVKGSEVVYVTIAFDYKTSVWKEKWPSFMKNLIESCKKHKTEIVFLDNMYMYDHNYLSNMTEETPINPSSKKGMIRKEVADSLVNAYKNGEVKGLIARAADFYGPGVEKSAFTQTVYGNLLKDKNPQWLGKLDVIHNFTYSKDIGKALALLGNTEDAFNQVWHLPTTEEKLTSRQWIELMMNAMNKQKKISVLPVSAMGLVGFFVPIIKELKDVSYQLDRDYYFNSSKFNKRFNFTPTDPKEAMREIVMSAKR